MRRITGISVLAIAGLAGCASTGSAPDQTAPAPVTETTRIAVAGAAGTVGTLNLAVTSSPNVGVLTLAAPIDQVWRELIAVYEALAIPTSTVDVQRRTLGNPSLKVRRRLGTVALTKYIDCGNTQGGQSAETYDVLLSIHSQLQSTPNGTTVRTTFQSSARPVTYSAEYRSCSSSGQLEARMGELLRARLGM